MVRPAQLKSSPRGELWQNNLKYREHLIMQTITVREALSKVWTFISIYTFLGDTFGTDMLFS